MSKQQRTLTKILSADGNVSFADMCALLESYGFSKRVKGSHHIFYRNDVAEIINLQPDGNNSKAYQVKQVRNILLKLI